MVGGAGLAGEVIMGGAKIILISIELLVPLPPTDPASFIQLHSAARGQRSPTDKSASTCRGELAPTNPLHFHPFSSGPTRHGSLISFIEKEKKRKDNSQFLK